MMSKRSTTVRAAAGRATFTQRRRHRRQCPTREHRGPDHLRRQMEVMLRGRRRFDNNVNASTFPSSIYRFVRMPSSSTGRFARAAPSGDGKAASSPPPSPLPRSAIPLNGSRTSSNTSSSSSTVCASRSWRSSEAVMRGARVKGCSRPRGLSGWPPGAAREVHPVTGPGAAVAATKMWTGD